MPKRSNEFQRLIKHIYDQLKPQGAVVTESASLPEYGGKDGPEIDILVEVPAPGPNRPFRVAVECRDHKRLVDKTWINELIGKYRDVPVDRVVAVSRSAFTKGARQKARQSNIEILTLTEALADDWPQDLMRVEVGEISLWPEIVAMDFDSSPPWPSGSDLFGVSIGDQQVDVDSFKLWLIGQVARAYSVEADRQRSLGKNSLNELGRHALTAYFRNATFVFRSFDGVDHTVSRIDLRGSVEVVERMLPVSRYRLGTTGVSRASTLVDNGRQGILVVQEPGKLPSVELTTGIE